MSVGAPASRAVVLHDSSTRAHLSNLLLSISSVSITMKELPPDLARLQLGSRSRRTRASRGRLPRHRRGEKFLKGPIPWWWLARAFPLPGRALHIGVALWFWAGIKRSARVSLSVGQLSKLGISRWSVYRALGALESAGLVVVDRQSGRHPVVMILDGRDELPEERD